jgi:hypothetical protein
MKEDTMKKTASYFSFFCGFAILLVWGILLATGQVIELRTDPFKTLFLLAAEFLTAFSLILGGFGLVTGKSWGLKADLAAVRHAALLHDFLYRRFGASNAPAHLLQHDCYSGVCFPLDLFLSP